jgi:hypothetical protein
MELGVGSATTTAGRLQSFTYTGNLSAIAFIQQTASATVVVSFYA